MTFFICSSCGTDGAIQKLLVLSNVILCIIRPIYMSENLITLEIFSGQPNNMGEAKLGKLKKCSSYIIQ